MIECSVGVQWTRSGATNGSTLRLCLSVTPRHEFVETGNLVIGDAGIVRLNRVDAARDRIVASSDEESFPLFQFITRGDPLGGDDVHPLSAVAA